MYTHVCILIHLSLCIYADFERQNSTAHSAGAPEPASYIYIYICIYIYVCMYVYVHIYIHTYTYNLPMYLCLLRETEQNGPECGCARAGELVAVGADRVVEAVNSQV